MKLQMIGYCFGVWAMFTTAFFQFVPGFIISTAAFLIYSVCLWYWED